MLALSLHGGVLWQRYGEDPLPVAYVSRRLNEHELNYAVQELDSLAIVYSVKSFCHYLLGSPFEIKVMGDHQSLQYLKKGRVTERLYRPLGYGTLSVHIPDWIFAKKIELTR